MQQKKQAGFALVETLVASVLIGIGIMGFFTLSNLHMQHAKHTQYHFVANAAATSLVASLRANPSFISWLSSRNGGNISVTKTPPHARSCHGDRLAITQPDSWCTADSGAVHTDLLHSIQRILSEGFHSQANTAVLCLRSRTTSTTTAIRVVVVWKNLGQSSSARNQQALTSIDHRHCPTSYDSDMPATVKQGKKNLGLAYVDLYTQI